MNKSELIDQLALSTELNKITATRVIDALLDVISDRLRQGDTVTLSGFGTFTVSNRAARNGRNPRTGEMIAIPASKSPRFNAGKRLKDPLN